MKKIKWMMPLLVGLLTGCEYTVPLVTVPLIDIDTSIVGLWERTKSDGQSESLLILPLDEKEYLVSYPAGVSDSMYARGALWHGPDRTLVQLDWFGSGKGNLAVGDRTFQYVTYEVKADALTIWLVNADVISKDVATTEELAAALALNRDHPELLKDPITFWRAAE